MKVFSIRVDEEVKKRLDKMDKEYIRRVLTELVGMTYTKDKRIVNIENYIENTLESIVKDYLNKHIDKFIKAEDIKESKEKIDQEVTKIALKSVYDILGGL